jgi:hypothetical protein
MLFSYEKYWENERDKSGNWCLTWLGRDSGLGKLCHLHNFPGSNFTCFDKYFKISLVVVVAAAAVAVVVVYSCFGLSLPCFLNMKVFFCYK